MNINRKQFLGTLFAGAATIGCLPSAFASKLIVEPTEFEKCRNDILYFVDNYLDARTDSLKYGPNYRMTLTQQQREYLKRMSTTTDILVAAKGRCIGASTANAIFAYWKTTFFGPDHHVWIVNSNSRVCGYMKHEYGRISDTGNFIHSPSNVHFITPVHFTRRDVNWNDPKNTYILDEFDWWGTEHGNLYMQLLHRIDYSRCLERGELYVSSSSFSPFIVPSTPNGDMKNFVVYDMKYALHESRYMELPHPEAGFSSYAVHSGII